MLNKEQKEPTAICPFCGGEYNKRGLKRHMGSCPENPANKEQDPAVPGRILRKQREKL